MKTIALCLSAALFAPALAHAAIDDAITHEMTADPDAKPRVLTVQDERSDPDFLQKFFAITFHDPFLHGEVDDKLVGLYIGFVLPFGFLWSPFVFGESKPEGDYIVDALLIEIIHVLLSVAAQFTMVLWWFPILGWVLGIAVFAFHLFNFFYWIPVNLMNAYDRSIPGGGGGKKKSSGKKRRRRSANLFEETPGLAAAVQPGGAVFAY